MLPWRSMEIDPGGSVINQLVTTYKAEVAQEVILLTWLTGVMLLESG